MECFSNNHDRVYCSMRMDFKNSWRYKMKEVTNNWLWIAVILPVLIGFFKTEIGRLLAAWSVYRLRAFDADGNPATSDHVQLLNGATGEWGDAVIERYVFSLSARTRGVYIRYPDGGREKVSLLTWAGFRKRISPSGGTK